MKKIITLSTLVLIVLFISCNGAKKASATASNEIITGKYEIRAIQGEPFNGKLFIMIDTSEKRISGKTGCNSYFGNYTISRNDFTFGPIGATEMYCEENVMKIENSLFEAFRNTTSYNFDNNMLTLSSKENGKVLVKLYHTLKK